jgi:7,8-dihydropterin-6-yl-methyl-4-(beta-D-ribofuranosyl)aminobenzene 5'-phosphate synthase
MAGKVPLAVQTGADTGRTETDSAQAGAAQGGDSMQFKATVLCENTVYGQGIAEHGWAVWLETPARNLLFDTGQGIGLLDNAALFAKDLASAQAVCISHHHYDHTGGLVAALKAMRHGVPVYAHPDLFKASYSVRKESPPRYIGIPYRRLLLESMGARLHLQRSWQEIADGLFMTGEIPRQTDFELGDSHMHHYDEQQTLVFDPVRDDQTLVANTKQGLVVLLGCSHAGVVNILRYIIERTGETHFHAVFGGTHLMGVGAEQVVQTVDALLQFEIERIGVSHCTGQAAALLLAEAFGERFFFCNVGTVVEV